MLAIDLAKTTLWLSKRSGVFPGWKHAAVELDNLGMSWFSTPADPVLRIRLFLIYQFVDASVVVGASRAI